jgi:hypothetical protein
MDEPEIVKLRKQIQLLNQYNSELKTQIEEQSVQIGEMNAKYNQLSTLFKNQSNQNELIKNKTNIENLIERSLAEEKKQTNKFKDSYLQLSNKIDLYEKIIKEKDSYIDKLVIENNRLKKDLINSSKNPNDYFALKKKQQEDEYINSINDKKNILNDFNKICDQMEDVLRENRMLRQMADVPENFGIDLNKIKIGEKIKIEDYKTKIRLLIHNIDELETERAKLKHNIYFLACSLQINEPPFHLLSKEQRVDLAVYAQKLYEGKINVIDGSIKKNEELNNIIEEKNLYIKKLENELKTKNENERHRAQSSNIRNNNFNIRSNNRYGEIDNSNNIINNNIKSMNVKDNNQNGQMNEILNLLKEQKEEFKRIMINNFFQYNNNIFLNNNKVEGFKNYLGNDYKIIRRSMGK